MTQPRSVLVITDGLRADLLSPARTPVLWSLHRRASRVADYRSIFPSMTRVCSSSIATGCRPAAHGLYGNVVAIDEGDGLQPMSVGPGGARARLRRAWGRLLKRPTVAERLRDLGGQIVFSNVSPGAAYFHDPEGFGFVYHRDGSYGPGGDPVPAGDHLAVSHDGAGDAAMTERFCREVLGERRPAHAVLWLCDPDKTGHGRPLGSPDYDRAVAGADACVGRVLEALAADDPAFERTLLLVGSDHGMETIDRLIPVAAEMAKAGLKASAESGDVAVCANGTAATVFLAPEAAGRRDAIVAWLGRQDWVGRVWSGEGLAEVGLAAEHGLAIAIDMRHDDRPNPFGVAGTADAAVGPGGDSGAVGCGMHGGLGANEQSPYLFVRGPRFAAGGTFPAPASLLDIAPTVLAHHGLTADGLDGRPIGPPESAKFRE